MIEQSQGWCCELCGCMINGLCNNDNGYVTHIDSCILNDDEEEFISEEIL